MNILNDLWEGSIVPREKSFQGDAEYHAASRRLIDMDNELRETLQPAQRQLLDAIQQEEDALSEITSRDVFTYAFCMGAKMMLAMMEGAI